MMEVFGLCTSLLLVLSVVSGQPQPQPQAQAPGSRLWKWCFVCSGNSPDRECESFPQYVANGRLNCTRQYCTSAVQYQVKGHGAPSEDVSPGDLEVVSVARNCEDLPRGNTCQRDVGGASYTCYSTCRHDYCNRDTRQPTWDELRSPHLSNQTGRTNTMQYVALSSSSPTKYRPSLPQPTPTIGISPNTGQGRTNRITNAPLPGGLVAPTRAGPLRSINQRAGPPRLGPPGSRFNNGRPDQPFFGNGFRPNGLGNLQSGPRRGMRLRAGASGAHVLEQPFNPNYPGYNRWAGEPQRFPRRNGLPNQQVGTRNNWNSNPDRVRSNLEPHPDGNLANHHPLYRPPVDNQNAFVRSLGPARQAGSPNRREQPRSHMVPRSNSGVSPVQKPTIHPHYISQGLVPKPSPSSSVRQVGQLQKIPDSQSRLPDRNHIPIGQRFRQNSRHIARNDTITRSSGHTPHPDRPTHRPTSRERNDHTSRARVRNNSDYNTRGRSASNDRQDIDDDIEEHDAKVVKQEQAYFTSDAPEPTRRQQEKAPRPKKYRGSSSRDEPMYKSALPVSSSSTTLQFSTNTINMFIIILSLSVLEWKLQCM